MSSWARSDRSERSADSGFALELTDGARTTRPDAPWHALEQEP
ncbi:hypothetical protein ACFZA9_30500 [Streptomyces olivaceus]